MQFASDATALLALITKMLLTMCKNTLIKETIIYNAITTFLLYQVRRSDERHL